MKFTFSMKVPMRDRLKILWLGGLYLTVDYKGQHKTAKCSAVVINKRDVSDVVLKQ